MKNDAKLNLTKQKNEQKSYVRDFIVTYLARYLTLQISKHLKIEKNLLVFPHSLHFLAVEALLLKITLVQVTEPLKSLQKVE